MKIIRDNFINKIETSAKNANGTYIVFQMGINSHAKLLATLPKGKASIGVGSPNNPNTKKCIYTPTNQEIQIKVQNNRNIIFELYLTEIVQHWYDFLAELYSFVIDQNLCGSATFDIPKSKINIDFSKSNNDLIDWVKTQSLKEFDFKAADDKLKIIRKIFSADFSRNTIDVSIIKTNIQVRNILQHRNGIINQEDLNFLGVSNIEQDEGNQIISLIAGKKVTRTVFDIEKLVISMKTLAKTLV